jgi:hypothetical protein
MRYSKALDFLFNAKKRRSLKPKNNNRFFRASQNEGSKALDFLFNAKKRRSLKPKNN